MDFSFPFFGDFSPLFDPFFSHHHHHGPFSAASNGPEVNAYVAEDGNLVMEFEVPRYKKENVSVTADAATGLLTVAGEMRAPQRGAPGSPTGSSRAGGGAVLSSFTRHFNIPVAQFDLSKLASDVQDGVLTITIPKKPEPKAIEPKPAEPVPLATTPAAASTGAAATAGTVATANSGTVATHGAASWPPQIRAVQATPNELTFTTQLPPAIAPENVRIEFLPGDDAAGQPGRVQLSMQHESKTKTRHGSSSSSRYFSTTMAVPAGVRREDITANVGADGKLDIQVKTPAAAAAPASTNIPVK